MNELLIPLSVIFALSLVGSIVLFRFLKSSAAITKSTYQAGGAIAGFILIYGLLYMSYNSFCKSANPWKPEVWTIRGTVHKEQTALHDGVRVNYIPFSPSAETAKNGEFRMEGVQLSPGNGLPTLQFDCEAQGFYPHTIDLQEDNVDINREKKQIVLKQTIELEKLKGGEQ